MVLARADARITEKIHEARPLTRYGLFRYREMYMRVLKFGGSSLADAERFLRVSDIVVNNQQQVQVALVLSAPAKVTNLLVALVRGVW